MSSPLVGSQATAISALGAPAINSFADVMMTGCSPEMKCKNDKCVHTTLNYVNYSLLHELIQVARVLLINEWYCLSIAQRSIISARHRLEAALGVKQHKVL